MMRKKIRKAGLAAAVCFTLALSGLAAGCGGVQTSPEAGQESEEQEDSAETLAEEKLPVCSVGVQDRFGEVGKLPYLRQAMGLTKEDILAAARKAAALK